MRTYWIVKGSDGEPHIVSTMFGKPFTSNSVGPFWTYKEAMGMLHFWSK